MYTSNSSVADRVEWMERWSQALDDIMSGRVSMAEASRKYGINAGSLSVKLKEMGFKYKTSSAGKKANAKDK